MAKRETPTNTDDVIDDLTLINPRGRHPHGFARTGGRAVAEAMRKARLPTVLEAIAVARKRGLKIEAPVSGPEYERVILALHAAGIEHNLSDELYTKRIIAGKGDYTGSANPRETTARYRRTRIRAPGRFIKGSLRTVGARRNPKVFLKGDRVVFRPDRADAYGEPRDRVYTVRSTAPHKRYKRTWVTLEDMYEHPDGGRQHMVVDSRELRPTFPTTLTGDFPITLIGDPGHAEKQREMIARLTRPRLKAVLKARRNPRRSPWAARKRYVLVYQGGIANVFQVSSFNLSDYGRDAKRLLQSDFRTAEAFARGLAAAGGVVKTAAANRAGDITRATWTDDLESQPFADQFRPVSSGKALPLGNPGVSTALSRRRGKRTVRQNPDLLVLGANPPINDVETIGRVEEIKYHRITDGKPYKHTFKKRPFLVLLSDGSFQVRHPGVKLWGDL